ncbi:MAG: HD domain-containing protein [Pleomorphochaeta sp.]
MKKNELLEYLETEFSIVVRDPLWKDIKLSESIYKVYMSKEVQKLSRIKQLGPTNLVYPGAMHTRLCHSLGVYHLSKEILITLITKTDNMFFTLDGVNSFLLAALLHDIGHFPYTHSLKELPLIDHEVLATNIISDKDTELNKILINKNFDILKICNILNFNEKPINNEIKLYKSLLSGALDPDKLDYLNRDAFFAGVTYGIQDSSYIISHLTIHDGYNTILESAKLSLENLIFSKYQMYKTVYWHKRVRCATAMIKKCLIYNLNNNIIKDNQLYNLDDYSFNSLAIENKNSFQNVLDVRDNKLLNTILEENFDSSTTFHKNCLDLGLRNKYENIIYNELKKNHPTLRHDQVIIDIPEPISFEIDIPILFKTGKIESFKQIDDIFNQNVIKGFERSLRKMRIFTINEITIEEVNKAIKICVKK